MSALFNLIKTEIKNQGPITLKRYIELCLYHSRYGYYQTQKVLGKEGDFITAPELTQVFGELLAMWFIDQWQQLGKPTPIQLIELGPGKGVMMQDMLRIMKQFPIFYQNLSIYLLECSPFLKEQQSKNLLGLPITWVKSLQDIPKNGTPFIVANEFFDALPIDQYCRKEQKWQQRKIGIDDKKLCFMDDDAIIYEDCSSYQPYLEQINEHLLSYKGSALIIDYGDIVESKQRQGDTIQAIHDHQYINIFEKPGESDLTHHVSFAKISEYINKDFQIDLTNQRSFLEALGIQEWTEKLCLQANAQTVAQLRLASTRLISSKEMGDLFKVLMIRSI